jgi:zinc protease
MTVARAVRTVCLATILSSPRLVTAQVPVVPPRPTPGLVKPIVFPKINVQTLPNGMRLAVIENHTLPIVTVNVGLLGGPFLDPPGKEGAWALMLNALREGTTSRSASEIADAAADIGTSFSWGPTAASANPGFTTIKSAWQPALMLVADMLMNPTFPPDAVARVQAAQVVGARPTQGSLPGRVATAELFGSNHLYARILTDSSLRRVTRDDLTALQSAYLRPQNAVIVIAGDVTAAQARAAVDGAFSSWKNTGSSIESRYLAPTISPSATTIYLRDFPGAPQSQIASAEVIPSRVSKDAPTIAMIDAIVGSARDGSRMWDALRGSHGLSYSPRSAITWRPPPQEGTWGQYAAVPAGKTDSAVVELYRVLRETHGSRPITATELDFARRTLVWNLSSRMETVPAGTALEVMVARLPTTYFTDYAARLNSMTLAEVQAAATKYIDPDHLVLVVVGDRAKIEAPLRATGIPVVIVP